MGSNETEVAIFIFLGVFCVLCPLFVFLIWYFFGPGEEAELKAFEIEESKVYRRNRKSEIAIVLEDTASDDENEDDGFAYDPDGRCASDTSSNGGKDSNGRKTPRKRPEIACPQELKANKGASMTNSNKVATIDVHKCTSSYCEHCRVSRTTQFVPAEPLEPTTAHRIRYISSPWWEVGGSLRELTANITGAFLSSPRPMRGAVSNDEDDDDKSEISRWTWRRKRGPKDPKTPRQGGENV